MAWIESHQQLERHPKTHELMSLMEWNLDTTIGKLMRFWWWSLDFAPSGDLRKYNDAQLGGSVGLPPAEASRFVNAMVRSCWIDRGEGVFRIHDWPHYAGRYLKESRFKRSPERWDEVVSLYSIPCPKTVLGQSEECPSYQPNQPTEPISPPITQTRAEPQWQQHVAEHVEGCELTEAQAIEQAHTAGVPEDFAKYVYGDWWSREGRDAGGVKTAYIRLCRKRWTREQKEWEKGTHKGKRTHENSRTGSQSRIGGTYDPDGTIASQY